jgi:hypothetical protein
MKPNLSLPACECMAITLYVNAFGFAAAARAREVS